MDTFKHNLFRYLPFIAIFFIYFHNLCIDVMDIDAAQYASISMEMLERGSFLEVTNRYINYLDKPPLLFWLSAFSFKIFGIHNWSYKLPSLIFSILGIIFTYRFTRLFYKERAAYFAALVLASCQAMFLITNDIRTDTNLLAAVIFAVYQLTKFNMTGRMKNLIWASVGIALAMLAKGPIGLMVPVLAIGTQLVIRKEWNKIIQWQWLFLLLLVALFITPMCIGLYTQFGTQGLTFYFWTQSFGRITGENYWRNDTGYFYFVHTTLWALIPWSLIFIIAWIDKVKSFLQSKANLMSFPEWISIGGFILPFIALSFSKYKLPHYIFVVFPFAAVLIGEYLDKIISEEHLRSFKELKLSQFIINLILITLGVILCTWAFPDSSILFFLLVITMIFLFFIYYIKSTDPPVSKMLRSTILTAVILNFILSFSVYPSLLKYEPSAEAGRIALKKLGDKEKLITYGLGGIFSFDFYAQRIVPAMTDMNQLKKEIAHESKFMLYTNEEGFNNVRRLGYSTELLYEQDAYPVTLVTLSFLNPSTRSETVSKRYLLEVKK